MKRFFSLTLALLLCFSTALFTFSCSKEEPLPEEGETQKEAEDPMSKLYENFIAGTMNGTLLPFSTPRNEYSVNTNISQVSKQSDGTLRFTSDVPYDKTSDFVKLNDHLTRTLSLAKAYHSSKDEKQKTRIKDTVLGLTEYWVNKDYQSTNWWYNEISTPNLLGEIALLMREEIPDELMQKILPIIGRGCFIVNEDTRKETGANAAWLAYSTLKYGILAKNEKAVLSAVNNLKSELGFSSGEGIRKDGSFMQHGARLYSGGYGVAMIKNTAYILYVIDGSDYQIPQEKLQALATMITEGLTYLSIGNKIDPQTVGREISRQNSTNILNSVAYLNILASLSQMPEKEKIKNYAQTIQNNTRADLGLKYFDEAAYLVINNSDFYFSFRGCNANLYYGENLNDENILSYNSSFGTTTTIVGTVADFEHLQPIEDYSLIPGTTAIYETDDELLAHEDYNKRKLNGIFGGQMFGENAVSFVQSKHEKIKYTVACFATNNSAFLMGAGLSATGDAAMITTLQQEMAQGEVVRNGNVVLHNGVKYTKYEGGNMSDAVEEQYGSWRRNNASGSTTTASGEVFLLTMENTGSYAYSVMAENTSEEYEIISNTTELQAVKMPDGSICAVFYSSGSFTYGGTTYTGAAGELLTVQP